jgi:hypothetical protein
MHANNPTLRVAEMVQLPKANRGTPKRAPLKDF